MGSLGIKTFLGLGSVAVVPLSASFIFKHIEVNSAMGGALIEGNKQISLATEENQPSEPIKQAIQIIEKKQGEENKKDDKGCFILPKLQGSDFFICVNMNTLDSLFLFNYAWRQRKLNEVVEITYKNTWPATMKFANGKSELMPSYLKNYFAWLQKNWKNTAFLPNHCTMTKKNGSQTDYVLSCNNPLNVSEKPHWSQEIPLSQITVHKNSFNLSK